MSLFDPEELRCILDVSPPGELWLIKAEISSALASETWDVCRKCDSSADHTLPYVPIYSPDRNPTQKNQSKLSMYAERIIVFMNYLGHIKYDSFMRS